MAKLTEVEPKGAVTWAIASDQLSQYNFQTPQLQENRYLSVSFGELLTMSMTGFISPSVNK